LLEEIASEADGAQADTVFFGGGTPSLLEPAEIADIIGALRRNFSLQEDAEITLEANPETVTHERLVAFRAAGVTRLSFGVQSFRDEELTRLSRVHSVSRAREAVGEARAAGFDNLSLDLMMWLPQQTVADWLESVEALVALGPDHASLYLLELYPNAPLRETMARQRWSLAADDDAADMYLAALARLDAAGFEQYEISNVTRPGRASRHNLKYWQDGEWLGFGCGAHSTRAGIRWKNLSSTEEYVAVVRGRGRLRTDVRTPSLRERAEEAVFMGLRLTDGVDLERVRQAYGVDLWAEIGRELGRFVEAGILSYDVGRLRLSRRGMLLANEVMAAVLGPSPS